MQIKKISLKKFIIYFYLVLPLFYSVNPIKLIFEVPGEVIPWAFLLFPFLYFFIKNHTRDAGIFVDRKIFLFYLLFILLSILGFFLVDQKQIFLTKIISLLNPIIYSISLLWLIKKRIITSSDFIKIIFWVNNFIIFSCLLTYISPQTIDSLRSIIVNDLGDRKSLNMLAYSGPASFYSEQSYLSLFEVTVLLTFISSRFSRKTISIIIQSLLIIILTRSITGLGLAILSLLILVLYLTLKYSFQNLLKRNIIKYNNRKIFVFVIISTISFFLLSKSGYLNYGRFVRLIDFFQDNNLFSLEALEKLESSFGSTRYMPMILGLVDNNNLPELLVNKFCFNDCSNFYLNDVFLSSFSFYFTFVSIFGIIIGNLFISYLIYIIYKYDSSLKYNSFNIKNQEKMSLRCFIFGIFSILFLGPIGSPLLLLPFISIF